ncbi:MAG: hypothetical protein ACR2OY_10305 [Boseongicola sp.]
MPDDFNFSRSGRQLSSIAYTVFAVVGLAVLIFGIDAHPLISAFFAVIVLPAVWDVAVNNSAELSISDGRIQWRVGQRENDARLDGIDRVTARTGLDFSQRVSIRMNDGTKRAIPPPCIPPGRELDAELKSRGVTLERTLFL